MGKFYQCIQSYGPSFMTKFCSALYLENLLRNFFAKLNLRGWVSCMPAALLLKFQNSLSVVKHCFNFLYTAEKTVSVVHRSSRKHLHMKATPDLLLR